MELVVLPYNVFKLTIVEEAPAVVRFPEMANEPNVPTLVREEAVTPEPKVSAVNTETPAIK